MWRSKNSAFRLQGCGVGTETYSKLLQRHTGCLYRILAADDMSVLRVHLDMFASDAQNLDALLVEANDSCLCITLEIALRL